MMWIELACRELLAKNIVQSDAHAEAAKLIMLAYYEAYLNHRVEPEPQQQGSG